MENRSIRKSNNSLVGQDSNKFIKAFGCRMLVKSPGRLGSNPPSFSGISPKFKQLKSTLYRSQLRPSTPFKDFMGMEFDANGVRLTGQTVLRNFGTGERNCSNFSLLKNAIGYAPTDFSDPSAAMEVLASIPDINLRSISLNQFGALNIQSDLYSGSASEFLTLALAPYRELGLHRPKAFYYFVLSAGIDRRDLLLEPEQLREVLDSAGFDFKTNSVRVHQFIKMKFHSLHLIGTGKSNGTLTGQSLLHRYGGGRYQGLNIKTLETVLLEAGYSYLAPPHKDPKHMGELSVRLSNKETIRKILDSAKKKVDWRAVRYNEFKYLKFDSPLFNGIGATWLKYTGDPTAKNMRRLLKKAGIINEPSPRWVNRVK